MTRQETKKSIHTNYPIFYLTKEEITDPHLVIKDFFSFEHLPQLRELIWLFYKMLVTGNYVHHDALTLRERLYLSELYEYLLKLVEAAHLLNEKKIHI